MAEFDPYQLLNIMLGAVGIVIGIVGAVHALGRQLKEQVYLEYTDRFRQLLGSLPLGALTMEFGLDGTKEDSIEWQRIMVILNQYFDLCSEEFKLNQRGLVTKEVWSDWLEGISGAMGSPLCQETWRDSPFAGGYETMKVLLRSNGIAVPDLRPNRVAKGVLGTNDEALTKSAAL